MANLFFIIFHIVFIFFGLVGLIVSIPLHLIYLNSKKTKKELSKTILVSAAIESQIAEYNNESDKLELLKDILLISPFNIEHRSQISAEEVGPGPAPSPCNTDFPIGNPSTTTAFKTPSILAIYELFKIRQGCTRSINLFFLISEIDNNLIL